MGKASLVAGDVDGGVEESTLEPEGAASSESPLGSWDSAEFPATLPQQPWVGEGVWEELPGLPGQEGAR